MSSILPFLFTEELDLVNKKGQELLVFFNQTWPDLAPGILQQQSISSAYKIMVEFKKAGNLSLGENLARCSPEAVKTKFLVTKVSKPLV